MSSLYCWRCSSDTTNGCASEIVNQTLIDPNSRVYRNCYQPKKNPDAILFCRKIKDFSKKLNHLIIFANLKHLFSDYNGTLILMRSCGFEDKNADPNSCSHQNPPVNRTKPFSCEKCYTDGCNE